MWVCIFFVRTWQLFLYQNYFGLLFYFRFCILAPPFSMGETLHVVYKKYKIKRKIHFSVNTKYYTSWVKNIIILTRFQHTRWNIFGIHFKTVNILHVYYKCFCLSFIQPTVCGEFIRNNSYIDCLKNCFQLKMKKIIIFLVIGLKLFCNRTYQT